jgi:hypothetical protein
MQFSSWERVRVLESPGSISALVSLVSIMDHINSWEFMRGGPYIDVFSI